MAFGSIYLAPSAGCGPATDAAPLDFIVGTSTPVENIQVRAYDQSTIQYTDYRLRLPTGYAGGGVTLSFCTSCGTVTGTIQIEAAFRAFVDDAEDLDTTAHTYDYNSVTISTLPNVVGEETYDIITFTNGADMDGLGAGVECLLRVRRNTADSAAAFAYIHGIEIYETP